jgi:competence protein ComEC
MHTLSRALDSVLAALFLAAAPQAPSKAEEKVEIVVTDMDGGASTLLVLPSGESVLIDCGSRFPDARDARRILEAAQKFRLKQIDHLVITHYHRDHWGAVSQLTELLPVRHFYDHGPLENLPEDPEYPSYLQAYLRASQNKRRTLKARDLLPLASAPRALRIWCVVARAHPLGPPSPPCAVHPKYAFDPTDNARSIGLVLEYADFRAFFGGDLTKAVEHNLVCPYHRIGEVDLYQVNHHGLESSNSSLFCERLNPTVAVIPNGKRKGAHPETHAALRQAKALRAVFQLHSSLIYPDANPPAEHIANLRPDQAGAPVWITCDISRQVLVVRCGWEGPVHEFPIRPGKKKPAFAPPGDR